MKKESLFKKDSIDLPAVRVFRADGEFVVNVDTIPKIYFVNELFTKLVKGVVEKNVSKTSIISRQLQRQATVKEIVAATRNKAISLAHFKILLGSQRQSFLAIVKIKGKVHLVCAFWRAGDGWFVLAFPDGWRVGAGPVGDPFPWIDESLVLSRK